MNFGPILSAFITSATQTYIFQKSFPPQTLSSFLRADFTEFSLAPVFLSISVFGFSFFPSLFVLLFSALD